MLAPTYAITSLPPAQDLNTVAVLLALNKASRALAQLSGEAKTIPNEGILIDTLSLQEALASSAIENIVTTQDEVHRSKLSLLESGSPAAKEVSLYRDALLLGFQQMNARGGLITNNSLIGMFQLLKQHDEGFRTAPGTKLADGSGNTIYVPPQHGDEIVAHMRDLESFVNDDALSDLDPLVKMALIHHQFESIHPFSDGNGRVGRILCVLYLTRTQLLDIPILYLSRYITANKADYYRELQAVRDTGDWEPWLLYMLRAVASTAETTLNLVTSIRQLMVSAKTTLRDQLPRLYSQDMLNNLFRHPYTRIEFLQNDLNITRQTASKYLSQLCDAGLLEMQQSGNAKYYVNRRLIELLVSTSGETENQLS